MNGPEREPREENDLPEELRPIADLLDEVAGEEQAVLREAAAMHDAPRLGSVDDVLERAWADGRGPGAEPRRGSVALRRILAGVAALAAGIALFAFVQTLREPSGPGPSDSYLGGNGFEVVAPVGQVDEFRVIEWTDPSAARWKFVVRVLDPAARRKELLVTPPLEGTRYALDPADTATWPDEIVIEIEAKDASNQLEDVTPSVSASRSAH